MTTPRLRVATYRYEHVEPLFDGRVGFDGLDVELHTADLASDLFHDMITGRYDACELGLTYFLRMWDTPERPFLAVPITPNRNFRHSALFVREGSGIERPEDLAGRTVGEFGLWGHDPGVWMKGILHDEHGLDWRSIRWVIGGTDHPIPAFDWVPQPEPAGVAVRHAPDGATLAAMLEDGELDALLSVDVPKALLDAQAGIGGPTRIRRLFPDYERVERDYYRRTGIFPMMHVVAIRRQLAETHPEVLRPLYDAFLAAKDLTEDWHRDQARKQHMAAMTPWTSALLAADRALLSDDWWPYGVARNRAALEAFLRYHHEQGLSRELVRLDDIVPASLLDT